MAVTIPIAKDRINIEIIGKYEPVGILGKGGQSYVLDARDLSIGEPCAIKVLFGYGPSSLADEYVKAIGRLVSARKAFKEIRPHDYIVRFLDNDDLKIDGVIDGMDLAVPCYFNVYERVDRYAANDVIEGLTPRQVARAGAEAASALAAMHEKGWVHRDVKPANLLLDKALHVHLGDFGLAYKMDEITGNDGTVKFISGIPMSDPLHDSETWAATLFGTPGYMSPEQSEKQHPGPQSDVFNLGVSLYEMITGRIPHRGEDALTLILSTRRDTPTHIREIRKDVPPMIATIIMKMLEKKPEDRGDLREFEHDLREASEAPSNSAKPKTWTFLGFLKGAASFLSQRNKVC